MLLTSDELQVNRDTGIWVSGPGLLPDQGLSSRSQRLRLHDEASGSWLRGSVVLCVSHRFSIFFIREDVVVVVEGSLSEPPELGSCSIHHLI